MDIDYIKKRHAEIVNSPMKALQNHVDSHVFLTITACIDELIYAMSTIKGNSDLVRGITERICTLQEEQSKLYWPVNKA